MAVQEIILLGNPALRTPCSIVRNPRSEKVHGVIANLADTLGDFRRRKGFGRGIAAPQIGSADRIIYISDEFRGAMINPVIRRRSRQTFRLWDDCLSFPDIMVEVRRNTSIVVEFQDERGAKKTLKAEGSLSELLQHEIDHVNGILAIDRAIDLQHIMLRSEFETHTRMTKMRL